MAAGKFFKFQGSTFAVQTGLGSGATISAISKANPAVVTATGHGLQTAMSSVSPASSA